MIYLDYHASAPLSRLAARVLAQWNAAGTVANPHSRDHIFGRKALLALEEARQQVAEAVGGKMSEITFLSGATEANNLALSSAAKAGAKRGRRVLISSAAEHSSVLVTLQALTKDGFQVELVKLSEEGLVDQDHFAQLMDQHGQDCALVSLMLANNEIGVIQDLKHLVEQSSANGAYFHTDAVQALGRLAIDVNEMGIDSLSLSGHKIGAPLGIGALWMKASARGAATPLLWGGGQEKDLRSGTVALPLAAAFGACAQAAEQTRETENKRLEKLRNKLLKELKAFVPNLRVNGSLESRLSNNLNVLLYGISKEELWSLIDGELAISTGSACASGSGGVSHVLRAIGVSGGQRSCSLRFGLGETTQESDIDGALAILRKALVGNVPDANQANVSHVTNDDNGASSDIASEAAN